MMKMIIFGFVLVLCLGLAWPQPEFEPEPWPGLAWRLAKFINALCEHLATRWGVSLAPAGCGQAQRTGGDGQLNDLVIYD